jgi:hypothetical protein
MAAVFDVCLDLGATPTKNVITNLRFNNADDNDQDYLNPIIIPPSGTAFSYWKHLYLQCTTAPSVKCDNFEAYSDETGYDTGVLIRVATNEILNDSEYDQADGSGQMNGNHTYVSAIADMETYTSASPLSLTVPYSPQSIQQVGEETNYLLLQMEILSTATPGEVTEKTITFSYDEQ